MTDATLDHNALAQAIDSTWGRSSTPKHAGHSVTFQTGGGRLKLHGMSRMLRCRRTPPGGIDRLGERVVIERRVCHVSSSYSR